MRPIEVLVADDHPLYRRGIVRALTAHPGIFVAGEVADGLSAWGEARRLRPCVVLLDLHMPGLDGIEVARQILSDPELVGVRTLLLSASLSPTVREAARSAGIAACLDKTVSRSDITDAVLGASRASRAEPPRSRVRAGRRTSRLLMGSPSLAPGTGLSI